MIILCLVIYTVGCLILDLIRNNCSLNGLLLTIKEGYTVAAFTMSGIGDAGTDADHYMGRQAESIP